MVQLGVHLPHVKFIFPNAPAIPITVNEGMLTPAWYNILSMSTISREQDEQGLLRSQQQGRFEYFMEICIRVHWINL